MNITKNYVRVFIFLFSSVMCVYRSVPEYSIRGMNMEEYMI